KADGGPPALRLVADAGTRETRPPPPHATIAPWQCQFAAYRRCQERSARRVASLHRRLARYVAHRSETRSPPCSIGLLGAIGRTGGIPSPPLNHGSAATRPAERRGGARRLVRNVALPQRRRNSANAEAPFDTFMVLNQ